MTNVAQEKPNASSNHSSDSEDTEGPEEGFDDDQETSEKVKLGDFQLVFTFLFLF